MSLPRQPQADLAAIATYSEKEWGHDRKERYMATLRATLVRVARFPGTGLKHADIAAGYQSVLSGGHISFYRETSDAIRVIRVLQAAQPMSDRCLESSSPRT